MAKAKKPGQAPKSTTSSPKSSAQSAPKSTPPQPSSTSSQIENDFSNDNASMYGGTGPARTSHREVIQLPVGFELPNGQLAKDAEVRAGVGVEAEAEDA